MVHKTIFYTIPKPRYRYRFLGTLLRFIKIPLKVKYFVIIFWVYVCLKKIDKILRAQKYFYIHLALKVHVLLDHGVVAGL